MKLLSQYTILFVLLIACFSLQAQQDPTYTMYNFNMNVINPAYVGSTENTQITANLRSQWIKLKQAPETQTLSLATPVNKNIGLGFSVVNDKVSVLKETDVYIDFSYKLQLSENNDLYLGLKAGGSFIDIDLQSLGINDDPFFNENVNRFNPNIGAGAYFKGKNYYFNVSTPVLLKSKRYEKEGNLVVEASDKPHIYIGGGYTFGFGADVYGRNRFSITPSVMTRYVSGVPFSMDVSAMMAFNERFELGASHRLKESISGIFMFKLEDWGKLGYAYDHTLTDVGNFSNGSHEIIFRINF